MEKERDAAVKAVSLLAREVDAGETEATRERDRALEAEAATAREHEHTLNALEKAEQTIREVFGK